LEEQKSQGFEADTAVHEPVKVKAEPVSSTVVFVIAPFAEGAQMRSTRTAKIGKRINECGDPMVGPARRLRPLWVGLDERELAGRSSHQWRE
jgi:hypothetical protein